MHEHRLRFSALLLYSIMEISGTENKYITIYNDCNYYYNCLITTKLYPPLQLTANEKMIDIQLTIDQDQS